MSNMENNNNVEYYNVGDWEFLNVVVSDIKTDSGRSPMTLREARITNDRYKNEDVIWGRPKGLLYGNLVGSGLEQKANLYPDKSSSYFVSNICLPVGSSLIIKGSYPYARYLSFTVANQLGGGQLGNGKFLRGDMIIPDDGSLNPFWTSNSRDVTNRNFTIYLLHGTSPPIPAPNTLYAGHSETIDNNNRIHFSIRIYLVDRGYDGTGCALLNGTLAPGIKNALPVVSLQLANGSIVEGPTLLKILRAQKHGDPPGYELTQWFKNIASSPDKINAPCLPQVIAQVFWNTDYSVTGAFEAMHPETRVLNHPPSNDGGFANNPDTKYLLLPFSFGFGNILVIQGRMPSHPNTRQGQTQLPENPQVQYFSISTGAGPASGEGYDTICDEQIPIDDKGFYTIVVCWEWMRPSKARYENGIAWLNPGAGEGHYVGARIWTGIVYIRYQNPSPDWKESPANIPMPSIQNPIPQDPFIMGPYYPVGKYISTAQEFDDIWDKEPGHRF